jgi:hypothetical protein
MGSTTLSTYIGSKENIREHEELPRDAENATRIGEKRLLTRRARKHGDACGENTNRSILAELLASFLPSCLSNKYFMQFDLPEHSVL